MSNNRWRKPARDIKLRSLMILSRRAGGSANMTSFDHGTLTGLGDDDHTQYQNDTRATIFFSNLLPTIDHGSFAGLGEDDHIIYLTEARAKTYLENSFGGNYSTVTPHGATYALGYSEQLVTLNTTGTTTDTTSATFIPANSWIMGCTYRITTTITGATAFDIGDTVATSCFFSGESTLTAGTTGEVLLCDENDTAAKVRITTTGTPLTGEIVVTLFWIRMTAPTS
jgi:hypothetical protein